MFYIVIPFGYMLKRVTDSKSLTHLSYILL
jgi:hypothetical protein